MMPNSPFYMNSYYNRKLSYQNYNGYSNNYAGNYYNNYYHPNSSYNMKKNNNYKKETIAEPEKIVKQEPEYEPEIFEIFGLKLYFDDILLICLIFFLYNEGVKDQYLFISLILLLLS